MYMWLVVYHTIHVHVRVRTVPQAITKSEGVTYYTRLVHQHYRADISTLIFTNWHYHPGPIKTHQLKNSKR